MEDKKIVVWKTFRDPMDAQLTLTRLQDAGFSCFLTGETTAWLRPMLDNSISGVQLHVFDSDIAAINEFLTAEDELDTSG